MIGSSAATTVGFFAAVASVAWSAAYAWAQWLAHRHDPPPDRTAPLLDDHGAVARLARLEAGLETLTLEVERLGEGQRYSVRLLEEQRRRALPSEGRAPEPGRVVTPH